MLNLVMTHSPRMAAMATNKRVGEEATRNPEVMHRIAWLRRDRDTSAPRASHTAEQALRERTA